MIEIDMSTSATVFSFAYVYISRRSTVKEQDNSILGNKLEKIYKIKYLFKQKQFWNQIILKMD